MGGVDVSANGGHHGVVNGLEERSLDGSVVDQGSLDTSRVQQGGVSLGLTLGDVRHSGGGGEGLEAGEDIAQEGRVESGVVDGVDQRSLVDQGSLDSRVVD